VIVGLIPMGGNKEMWRKREGFIDYIPVPHGILGAFVGCIGNLRIALSQSLDTPLKCLCAKGFNSERCTVRDLKLVISFDDVITLPQDIPIHCIETVENDFPARTSTYAMILLKKRALTISWSKEFDIAFVEETRSTADTYPETNQ
ncbi:unnamed protein product, partial [Adineta ricciae]